MSIRRVRMMAAALGVLQDELNKLHGWTMSELQGKDADLQDVDLNALFTDFEDALEIYVEARNSYADEGELALCELTLNFGDMPYSEMSSQ